MIASWGFRVTLTPTWQGRVRQGKQCSGLHHVQTRTKTHSPLSLLSVPPALRLPVCLPSPPSPRFHPVLQLERVRKEQGDAAADKCGAGFYYNESATTRFIILALPKPGACGCVWVCGCGSVKSASLCVVGVGVGGEEPGGGWTPAERGHCCC